MLINNVKVIGTTFQDNTQWYTDENALIDCITRQINHRWPDGQNLLINTTWFGPQFSNNLYQVAKQLKSVDRLFLLASVDPVMMSPGQINELVDAISPKETYYLGNFDGQYQFTFIATLLPGYFKYYSLEELQLDTVEWIYVNYNRKPREHRINFVNRLVETGLLQQGVVTLGKSNNIYTGSATHQGELLLGEEPDDYAQEGNWGMSMEFGIPHDIHSLGNMMIWKNHFLTVVSETEFLPWDNMFVTEKTWKPILGLRPFLLNGQTKIYAWLRSQGFRTFTHYFPGIELEQINELEVHSSLIQAIQYLAGLSRPQLLQMYQNMLPDLLHNRTRFLKFAQEQQDLYNNIFNQATPA
jgi:hypothetical protein